MDVKHITKQKMRVPTTAWVCLILAVLLAGTGVLFARYRSEMKMQAEMIAANFHISSDYLEETTNFLGVSVNSVTYTVPKLMGEKLTIKLYNYEKENIDQVSRVDIAYDVRVTGGSSDVASGKFGSTTQDIHTLNITPASGASEVTVEVTTTSPYVKTLKATFQLSKQETAELQYDRVTDKGDYYLVTIYTGQDSGDKTLTWTEGLIPDNTNPNMIGWSGTFGSFATQAYTTYELIFFNPLGISKSNVSFSLAGN